MNKPILSGPYYRNFKSIVEAFKDNSAIKIVSDAYEIYTKVLELEDASTYHTQIDNQNHVLNLHHGTSDKLFKEIRDKISNI